jgi:hypothetical protein
VIKLKLHDQVDTNDVSVPGVRLQQNPAKANAKGHTQLRRISDSLMILLKDRVNSRQAGGGRYGVLSEGLI